MKPPISWYGGKTALISKLLPYVPKHEYYGEVFGGAGAVLFAKPITPFEVYNDINKDVVNLYRVIRDKTKFEDFKRLACLSLWSREDFWNAVKLKETETDDVLRAYYFYIVVKQSFSSVIKNPSFGMSTTLIRRNMPATCSKYLSGVDRLPEIHKRLSKVQIENIDFRHFFKLYILKWNKENTFVYLDPPYVHETRVDKNAYTNEMTSSDHEELIELLLDYNNNAMFMLSGYDNEIYRKLEENGWRKICFDWVAYARAVQKSKKKSKRTECIWMNYS